MARQKNLTIFMLVLFSICLLLSAIGPKVFVDPYPRFSASPVAKYALIDMSGVLFGARRLAADIAWVELLLYYGSPEEPLDKDTEFRLSWDMTRYLFGIPLQKQKEDPVKPGEKKETRHAPRPPESLYPQMYSYCLRVANLDPFFSYAYLYGAGALAWNLNRPDEAMKLLETGISSMEKFSQDITKDIHQPFWQYHLYMSAIIYSKSGKFTEMTAMLETAVKQPGCPNMVKAILANIFQKNGQAVKAMKLWLEIYDSSDPTYADKALSKISELKSVLNIR